MANGKFGDNPLSDLTIHKAHPFPPDIEEMLLKIHALGRKAGRYPLGEDWPFSPKEFDWCRVEISMKREGFFPICSHFWSYAARTRSCPILWLRSHQEPGSG